MTASTLTVTDFVSGRLAEDEELAWYWRGLIEGGLEIPARMRSGIIDPARVLAQCAAMRKVLMAANILGLDVEAAFALILAPVWADHPDFNPGWPTGT